MMLSDAKRRSAAPIDASVQAAIRLVSAERLRGYVEMFAFPRHYTRQRKSNLKARDRLIELATSFGYEPTLQGRYDNVVMSSGSSGGPCLLLGAHYDSVPGTPGADDNGSAMAVCLECARIVKARGIGGVMIVFFNREEDGLLGSSEFVTDVAGHPTIDEAHIFEMVGYCDPRRGAQTMPYGLSIAAPDTGDFLALLANNQSNAIAEQLLHLAASYVPAARVLALKLYLGIEKRFGHLNRSDHAPFWNAQIPAVMWTDTADFRNPHYHQASDTPDTLDYEFMADVTRLALARAALRTAAT
jgi:hypothetical protein